jgi:hypothetical protein
MTARTSVCVTALGTQRATYAGAFSTVQSIRDRHLSATTNADDVFKDIPGGVVAIYCAVPGTDGGVTNYAVTTAGKTERLSQ